MRPALLSLSLSLSHLLVTSALAFALLLSACGPPRSIDAREVLRDLPRHLGKSLVVRARFKSGARCRQGETGEWKTYCKDCQYCKGPIVLDEGTGVGTNAKGSTGAVTDTGTTSEHLDDWPLILGGTWEGKDIRCKGPLNEIECYPFVPGHMYVVQGLLENQRPPKLLVERFWKME